MWFQNIITRRKFKGYMVRLLLLSGILVIVLALFTSTSTSTSTNPKVKRREFRTFKIKYRPNENHSFTLSSESRFSTANDEKYYEEELKRLKESPFVYTSENATLDPVDPSLLMPVKYISWFPQTATPITYEGCPYSNCRNGSEMKDADLVVFDPIMMRNKWITARRRNKRYELKIPKYDRGDQIWAIYTIDPPWWVEAVADISPEILGSFNLTMSYRRDADMTYYFGRLKKRTLPITKDYGALFDNKTSMGVWLVTHCTTESRRGEYIALMRDFMDIDVYGHCGNKREGCNVGADWERPDICLPGLGKEYKFYIAFENHYCPDYISEKYFKLFWENKIDMIPVLRGPLDHSKYLPRDTYVDADDFQTPQDLARYLVDLGNDKERYIEMLRRKDRWTLADADHIHCKMCEMAHTKLNHIGYHPNFLHAFYGGHNNPCVGPTDL